METNLQQSEYFSSYEDLEVHRLMLEDDPRTLTYKDAVFNNKAYFKDKVVMDVGCGTGILSIFCAQAGAKKVYAVEASNLAYLAKEVVKENGFEHVIEIIHSRVEDVTLPNNIKVDAIVSEWMGFYLLHEGMLDSVLVARDKFLKPNGVMFPESAAIYIAPCSVSSLHKKWENLHGVSMKTFGKHLRASKGNKPEILDVQAEDLLGPEVALCWISLGEDEVTDLNSFSIQHVVEVVHKFVEVHTLWTCFKFSKSQKLAEVDLRERIQYTHWKSLLEANFRKIYCQWTPHIMLINGASKPGLYQGLCLWFECNFPDLSNVKEKDPIILDTSPKSTPTHWKQTVIVLPEEQEVDKGEPIAFQLDMERDLVNNRRYNLQMTLLDPEAVEHPIPCTCHMTKCILASKFMQDHAEHTIKAQNSSHVLEEDNIDDDDG